MDKENLSKYDYLITEDPLLAKLKSQQHLLEEISKYLCGLQRALSDYVKDNNSVGEQFFDNTIHILDCIICDIEKIY